MSSECSKQCYAEKSIDSGYRGSLKSNSLERHSNHHKSQDENASDIFGSDGKDFENDLMQSMYLVENENEEVVDKFTQQVKKSKPEFKSGLGR